MPSARAVVATARKVRPRVLCVDDEPNVVAAITDRLCRQFEIASAQNGTEGLRVLASRGPFAVVISDFAMPGMNGADFLACARMVAPESVRILLTGRATLEDAISAVNQGQVFQILTKPCSGEALVSAVEKAAEHAAIVAERGTLRRAVDEIAGQFLRAQRLASVGTMAATIGHELGVIGASLDGVLEAVERASATGRPLSPPDIAGLREVRRSLALHTQTLVEFTSPARHEGAAITDLAAALRDTVSMLRTAGTFGGVEVTLDAPSDPVRVSVGREDVIQILLNLLKNAAEACGNARRPDPLIRVAVAAAGNGRLVRCTVADNGHGIPAIALPLVFEPYYTTKPAGRGIGLGLFVVKQIAEGAGGEVHVSSDEARRTAFTVALPAAR